MPGKAAKVVITERQQEILTDFSRSRTEPSFLAQRSSIIRHRYAPARGRTISDLMNQCSRPHQAARHPISDQLSRPTDRGTIFHQDSTSRAGQCSPIGG